MRRAALSLLFATLAIIPASADGDAPRRHAQARGLPPPQPGVVVTLEHGVRVWRPVTAVSVALDDASADAYPQSYATNGAYPPSYGYGSSFGWGYPYGNGDRHGHRFDMHEHEHRFGVRIIRPQLPRYALAPARPGYSLPMAVHVNIGPMAHGAPHRGGPPIHGGQPVQGHVGGGHVIGHRGGHGHH